MAKTVQQLEHAAKSMNILGIVLFSGLILLIIFTISLAVYFGISISGLLSEGYQFNSQLIIAGPNTSFSLIYVSLYFSLFLLIEVVFLVIAAGMKNGGTPFTKRNTNMLIFLGVLNLALSIAKCVLEYLQYQSGYLQVSMGLFQIFCDSNSFLLLDSTSNFRLDIGLIFSALLFFILSAIWHYAYLLQRQSDDLV